MNDRARQALSTLREIRDALGDEDAPRRINLRDYVEPGTPAWDAYVDAWGIPGRKVRRRTMLARINQAIDALTTQLLEMEEPPVLLPSHKIEQQPQIARDGLGDTRYVERQRLRQLTPDGIERARQFLADLRDDPSRAIEPPSDLLNDERYATPFVGKVEVERRTFKTRRDAADYLEPLLKPITHLVADHAEVWSWLGMFYFPETVRKDNGVVRLSPLDETFVIDHHISRSYQLRYRHYLWGSWRLNEQHGESVEFLLNRKLTQWGDIEERSFGSIRIFNSVGVVPLILRLYTHGTQQKPGFNRSQGGLRHLIRVLAQLERTYDVYGMEPDALLNILPEEFQQWDGGPGSATR